MVTPSNFQEALQLVENGHKPFAGGTDLMVIFESGRLAAGNYVNIWNLKDLKGIDVQKEIITLGALTTFSEIRECDVLRKEFPNLCQAAKETGAIAIQNRGTIGGNIANASPAADSPPALLCYDAELELSATTGTRWINYQDFHLGYKKTALQKGEIISRLRLRRSPETLEHFYRKVGTRKAQAISKVGVSIVYKISKSIDHIRITFSSVAPTPLRCFKTENLLIGKSLNKTDGPQLIKAALSTLETEINPIDDIRSTARYRRRVALNLLEDFLVNHVELG
jgi:CO/xanthine dehydrogenase FAD-binding subunit